jgi:hypothetical protein
MIFVRRDFASSPSVAFPFLGDGRELSMARLAVLLIVGGGFLSFMGGQEFLVSRGASSEPAAVELASLEAGEAAPNNHLRVGEHIALYPACVYSYQTKKHVAGDPEMSAKVNYCFYPIISREHEFIRGLIDQKEKPEGPGAVAVPTIRQFAVLVKTRQFKTIGAIPSDIGTVPSVQGLVINQIDSLDGEEEKLIKENFPQLNVDKVLILEEGRRPASLAKSLGMVAGGVVLVIGGLALLVNRG